MGFSECWGNGKERMKREGKEPGRRKMRRKKEEEDKKVVTLSKKTQKFTFCKVCFPPSFCGFFCLTFLLLN